MVVAPHDWHPPIRCRDGEKRSSNRPDIALPNHDNCAIYGLPEYEFEQVRGIKRLREACEENGVTLLCCRGGITSGICLGPDSVGLALAAPPHEFKEGR